MPPRTRTVPAGGPDPLWDRTPLGELVGDLTGEGGRPRTGARRFGWSGRVGLSDSSPGGRARLDALARWAQEVAADDAEDAGLLGPGVWVVRRTVIAVLRSPRYRERFQLTTWCPGWGPRWAERRTRLVGSDGADVRIAALWVYVDRDGRPRRLPDGFEAVWGPGRRVRPGLWLPDPVPGTSRRPWQVRFADVDLLRHVNNAAYWVALEEVLAPRRDLREPLVAVTEHRAAVVAGEEVELVVSSSPTAVLAWWTTEGQVRAAMAALTPPVAGVQAAGR